MVPVLKDKNGKVIQNKKLTAEQIVAIAKSELDSSSGGWVDRVAGWFIDLLLTMGAKKEADEVYEYYNGEGEGEDEE